jgi:hypothetical protein
MADIWLRTTVRHLSPSHIFVYGDSRRNGLAEQGWRQSFESDGCGTAGTAGTARVAAAVGTVSQTFAQQGEHSTMPCVQGVLACRAKH